MSPKIPVFTGRELIRILERKGFVVGRTKGSHVHLFRSADRRRVTVPIHKGRDIPLGTLRSILKDADISLDEAAKLR